MLDQEVFHVQVLIFERSARVRPSAHYLEKEELIIGPAAYVKFVVHLVEETEHLFRLIKEFINRGQATRIVLLSDLLALRKEQGGWEATPLARQVRDLFIRNPTHLCALIAILNDQPHRVTDIDSVLKIDDVTPEALKRKVLQVATGLWLKSPVSAQSSRQHQDAIRVHSVRSEEELKECFKLRHRVYDALGYLEEPVSRSKSRIDLDSFDTKAIHFAATDHRSHEVVGTARLVTTIPRYGAPTIIGDSWRVISDHGNWAKAAAREALLEEDRVFHEKLNQSCALPFPILFNSDFSSKYRAFMEKHPPALGGEVSRLIVSPLYRGLGISALLMRAVISVACHLKKTFLLLECVPAHAAMYEKHGFRLINGHHCRAQDLDQVAVGMSLDLDDHPFNKAVALAKSDGRLLGEHGHLCLCQHSDCWKRREFHFRHNESQCPLIEVHRGLERQAG